MTLVLKNMNILPNLQKLKSPIVFLKLTPKKHLYATRKTDNITSFNLRQNFSKTFSLLQTLNGTF